MNSKYYEMHKKLLKCTNAKELDDTINDIPLTDIPLVLKMVLSTQNSILSSQTMPFNTNCKDHIEGEFDNKYSDEIMSDLRQFIDMDNDGDDDKDDDQINNMTPSEVLSNLLEWNGICNYSGTIKSWVQEIWNVNLDCLEER